eukprot:TRINITY_DN4942_c1_g1_i1.p1 TRINITY_DN4942_c1_g1~~TRINITY_DN4942_c1_g1_i1.p1  ORF type:complete len:487 (+),score=86.64 TRINITY_DN4942_c1_g1_i1:70-1530(+)
MSSEAAACLADVRAALTKAESVAESLVSEEELQRQLGRMAEEAREAVKKARLEAAVSREMQESAENRVDRLEEKLDSKRVHIKKLEEEIFEMQNKMDNKKKEMKELEGAALKLRDENRMLQARLQTSLSGALKDYSSKNKQPDKDSHLATREKTGSRPRSRSSQGSKSRALPSGLPSKRHRSASGSSMSCSPRSSPVRGPQPKGRSRSGSGASRSVSSKRQAARDRRDSRGRGRNGTRRSHSRRSKSRGRSRSRGKGADGQVPLCIPYVQGTCRRGDKCRDRHPDRDDCRQILDGLQRKPCRYGEQCKRRDCIFKHPPGRAIPEVVLNLSAVDRRGSGGVGRDMSPLRRRARASGSPRRGGGGGDSGTHHGSPRRADDAHGRGRSRSQTPEDRRRGRSPSVNLNERCDRSGGGRRLSGSRSPSSLGRGDRRHGGSSRSSSIDDDRAGGPIGGFGLSGGCGGSAAGGTQADSPAPPNIARTDEAFRR